MAERLNYSGDPTELQKIMRQIRHWTLSDLLHTQGRKHTGTGVSRRYRHFELQKAAILRELSHYGLQIGQFEALDKWLESIGGSARWKAAEEGTRMVFIQLSWGDQMVGFNITVDAPMVASIGLDGSYMHEYDDGTVKEHKGVGVFYSSVVVNLTRLLHRLGTE
ncbi:hypothetical protein P24_13468 [Oceanibaculum indicum P24]|uniref:HTH merR-type domain-containing protein n=2 Tax=Oceanibaculum indicum TaxID=526216 RepID=K2JPK0_9PROT|nr:hypothetical protein P24_13468 [Oceanibaculum indicum P24]